MPGTPQLITYPRSLSILSTAPRPLGFVPTMGALHRGHFSLLARARRECATVIASIYINPLQFNHQEDLSRYPRTLAEDLALCAEAEVDYVFAPQSLNEAGSSLVVPPVGMTNVLCGISRPGHFTGVATVVVQLLNLVKPDRAYFGQKDAQQLAIIQRLVRDLYLSVGIVGCTTMRDFDGVALSSRNSYLSKAERELAPLIYEGLRRAQDAFLEGEAGPQNLRQIVIDHYEQCPDLRLDYVELVHPVTLHPQVTATDPTLLATAVYLGNARLIDSIRLTAQNAPIIAIDGPAGSGKSTVARLVAQQLNFTYLDTGAMYRAVTWAALERGIPLTPAALTLLTQELELKLRTTPERTRIWVNDTEVTTAIRTQVVSAQVSTVAAVAGVRQILVQKQQALGQRGGVVVEGRDIGTQVFPQAELKIFLTASPEVRAGRRLKDLALQGEEPLDLATLSQQISDRDRQDATRTTSPLVQAADALVIGTDQWTVEQVVEQICVWARYL